MFQGWNVRFCETEMMYFESGVNDMDVAQRGMIPSNGFEVTLMPVLMFQS